MIALDLEKAKESRVVTIKVVGVGGAGGNTVKSIIDSGYNEVEFVVVNTDAQALQLSSAQHKIQIGVKSTKGLGTGANPEIGKRAAEEDIDKVLDEVGDAEIVFLAAGMGGGTGSGALPVIAHALRERGILSVAIVTKPFLFEGKRRAKVAESAIAELEQVVDTLIVIPNQKLLDVVGENVSMIDAFAIINDMLCQSVRGISDIIARPGHINVDFADVRTIMKDRGLAVMGTARATGVDRAEEAALEAISSPLLENMSIAGACGVLFNVTGGKDLGLHEISKAASIIYEQAHEDANIIIGSVIDENLTDEVIVTVIATGFGEQQEQQKVEHEVYKTENVQQPKQAIIVEKEIENVASERIVNNFSSQELETIITQSKEQQKQEIVQEQKTKEQKTEEKTVGMSLIVDPNDLDVPAFLREK